MRIGIDKDVCIGAGQCALTAPSVFTQDDDGFSALLPGRAGLVAQCAPNARLATDSRSSTMILRLLRPIMPFRHVWS